MLVGRYWEDLHECERQLLAQARAGDYVCAPFSPRENDRLAFLKSCNLASGEDPNYERIVTLLAEACDVPIAAITLVEDYRQFFKAQVGLDTRQTGRDASFCAHSLAHPGKAFVVPDATQDPRFQNNPLVVGKPNIRFYAGIPIVVDDVWALGALCVIDRKPRTLTDFQLRLLDILADFVSEMIGKGRTGTAQRVELPHMTSYIDRLAEVQPMHSSGPDTPPVLATLSHDKPRRFDAMALQAQQLTDLLDEMSRSGVSSPHSLSKLHARFNQICLLHQELFSEKAQFTLLTPLAASFSTPSPSKRPATSSLLSSRLTKRPNECRQCHTTSTPEWRRGPLGPRTLCNACGLRYAKRQKKIRHTAKAQCSVNNLCS